MRLVRLRLKGGGCEVERTDLGEICERDRRLLGVSDAFREALPLGSRNVDASGALAGAASGDLDCDTDIGMPNGFARRTSSWATPGLTCTCAGAAVAVLELA